MELTSCSRGRTWLQARCGQKERIGYQHAALTRMRVPALPRSPPHFSDGTAGVWRGCLPSWPMREASARRNTRHQCKEMSGHCRSSRLQAVHLSELFYDMLGGKLALIVVSGATAFDDTMRNLQACRFRLSR